MSAFDRRLPCRAFGATGYQRSAPIASGCPTARRFNDYAGIGAGWKAWKGAEGELFNGKLSAMEPEVEAALWVVAGCLFEVSLPTAGRGRWRWENRTPAVTILADEVRQGQHHFRFRAEAAGALAGVVHLRFRSEESSEEERQVAVRIAPERLSAS